MSSDLRVVGLEAKGKVTRRERFLAEMDAVIPWARLLGLIEPHYPKAGNGRQPLGLEKMLRIYFLQQWFNLSDPQAEDAIYDSESMRRFARVELGEDVVPDETTILRFRHLLEQHRLTQAIFDAVASFLEERAAVAARGDHRRRDHHRGAEFDQERECGARPRDEADPQGQRLALRHEAARGYRSARYRAYGARDRCAVADITQFPQLLHGEEREVFGDQAYWKEADRAFWRLGSTLPDQSAPQPQAAERALADDQSRALADPRLRRACLSGRQTTVGVHQGEIPRFGQEPGARADHVRAGQSLPVSA